AKFLDAERHGIMRDIATHVRHGEVSSVVIVLSGVAAAILLIALSFMLSRVLSRALQTQINALTELGSQGGANVHTGGADEVERIAQAIAAFRQSLLQLRDSEQTLRTEAERHLTIYAEIIRSTGEAVAITDLSGLIIEV